ncbi:hypothetical protein [Lysobacter sp. M2-1]|uniref:hypothetical protein n=1 Tax=Lysobacter sp. M2-1 TaxID=2916839 RepID=UPI001F55AACF|nr:hypothetical protein [Lysobacter sp. M2-1]
MKAWICHTSPRRTASPIGLLLVAACLFSTSAHAQFIVEDPLLIEKSVAEYIETAKRWKDTYDHYQQQLIRLKSLNLRMERMADNFPERDANHGVEQACPGPGGVAGGIEEMFRAVAPAMNSDILQQQRVLCIRMVRAENQRYNETVRMLKRMLQHQRDYQHGIEAQRAAVGNRQGDLAANDNETNRFVARMEMDRDYWMARNKAFDTYIATLQQDHGRLAKRALGGNKDTGNPILGKLVHAATLKTALSH